MLRGYPHVSPPPVIFSISDVDSKVRYHIKDFLTMAKANTRQSIFAFVRPLIFAAGGVAIFRMLRSLPIPQDAVGPVSAESWVSSVGLWVSRATEPAVLLIVVVVAALLAYEAHHTQTWIHITASLTVAVAVGLTCKQLLQVPRPDDSLLSLHSYSYPSIHATAAGVLWVVGSFHLQRLQCVRTKTAASVGGITAIIIGVSRIVVGVHTVSDVFGGLLLGLGLGLLFIRLWPQTRRYFECNW